MLNPLRNIEIIFFSKFLELFLFNWSSNVLNLLYYYGNIAGILYTPFWNGLILTESFSPISNTTTHGILFKVKIVKLIDSYKDRPYRTCDAYTRVSPHIFEAFLALKLKFITPYCFWDDKNITNFYVYYTPCTFIAHSVVCICTSVM